MKNSLPIITLLLLLCSPGFSQPPDLVETRQLAEEGDAIAQLTLGAMYATGEGVPENDAEAVKWFSMAATQGHEAAMNNREIVSTRLNEDTRNSAQQLATRCFDSGFKQCE